MSAPDPLPAETSDLAERAVAALDALDAGFDAVERALAQLDERPPPTCARCGAVLVDVVLGRRPLPPGAEAACAPACAS